MPYKDGTVFRNSVSTKETGEKNPEYQNPKKPPGAYLTAPGGPFYCLTYLMIKLSLILISDDLVIRYFFQRPFVGLFVVCRVDKAEPLFVILTHEVASVVESREA